MKKEHYLFLTMALSALPVQAITIDFEDFESGIFDSQWVLNPHPDTGRIEVANSPAEGTAAGNFAMYMDQIPAVSENRLNEATWTVDLSGFSDVILTFFHTDFGEAENSLPSSFVDSANGDGVAVSADGTNWFTILNATDTSDDVWNEVTVDLSAAAAGFGIATGSGFQIRFQNFENGTLPNDGRGYDEILLSGTAVSVPEPPVSPLVEWIGPLILAGLLSRRRVESGLSA